MRLIDADALIDRIKNPYEQAQVARWVNEQPTIEPEKRTEERTETHACDLIDREAAIRAVNTALFPKINTAKDAEKALRDLPSAQPEIIHCKECKYGVQDEGKRWYCRGLGCQVGEADGSGFCADAERRE